MAEIKKVPAIRFKGFSDEWSNKEFENILEIIDGDRGSNYPNSNDFLTLGHTLFLNASNVTSKGFRFNSNLYITEEKSNKLGNGKLLVDDIVLTSRGSLGHVAWYSQDIHRKIPFARINSGMLILRTSDSSIPSFIAQYLTAPCGQKRINLIGFGSAQPQLTKKDISKFVISLPLETNEQIQIGSYFQDLDKLISLHQTKVNKLTNLKKAMLEKMFPKQGADVPEIRFKGFAGAWDEDDLGQLAKITTGSSNREDSGLDGEYTFFDRSDDIRTSNIYLFDCEAVIVAGEGSDFVPKYFVGKFDLHQRTYAIMNFDKLVGKFLYYYIYLFRKHFLDYAVGSTVKSLRLPMFKEMPIKYPNETEQEKIGSYFYNFDKSITMHQTELEKLNNLKKACLEKMFV